MCDVEAIRYINIINYDSIKIPSKSDHDNLENYLKEKCKYSCISVLIETALKKIIQMGILERIMKKIEKLYLFEKKSAVSV